MLLLRQTLQLIGPHKLSAKCVQQTKDQLVQQWTMGKAIPMIDIMSSSALISWYSWELVQGPSSTRGSPVMLQNTMGEPSKSCIIYILLRDVKYVSPYLFLNFLVSQMKCIHLGIQLAGEAIQVAPARDPKLMHQHLRKHKKKNQHTKSLFYEGPMFIIHSSIHAFPWIHPVIHSSIHPCPSIPIHSSTLKWSMLRTLHATATWA